MTLPSSGDLSFAMIKAEFVGSDSFADYYRGGPYVPNTAANAAISTTAVGLAFSQFYGASKSTVLSSSPTSVSGSRPRPGTLSGSVVLSKAATGAWLSGGTNITVSGSGTNFTFSSTTNAGAASLTRTGTYRFTATDGSGQIVDVPVSFEFIGTA